MKKNIILTLFFFGILLLIVGLILYLKDSIEQQVLQQKLVINPIDPVPYLNIRSIDTMKYSRDLSREKLNDQSFDKIIDKQMWDFAATGAN